MAALPLRPGMRVLEIGCGPGVAARLLCKRLEHGFVLAIDRSARAIELARRMAASELAAGTLALRVCAVEELLLAPNEAAFDLAFAMRVGALDGRHPHLRAQALERIAAALRPRGKLFVDGGDPLLEVQLPRRRGLPR